MSRRGRWRQSPGAAEPGRRSDDEAERLEARILEAQPRCPEAAREAHERRSRTGRWSRGRQQVSVGRPAASPEEFWSSVLGTEFALPVSPPSSPTPATFMEDRKVYGPGAVPAGMRSEVAVMHDLRAYDCAVCLGPMTRTNVAVLLPCFHRFCYRCITRWLRRQGTCALCKAPTSHVCYSIRNEASFKVKEVRSRGAGLRLERPKPAAASTAAESPKRQPPAAAAAAAASAAATPAGLAIPAKGPATASAEPRRGAPRCASAGAAAATAGAGRFELASFARSPAGGAAGHFLRGALPLRPHPLATVDESGALALSAEATDRLRRELGLAPLRAPEKPAPAPRRSPRLRTRSRTPSPPAAAVAAAARRPDADRGDERAKRRRTLLP